MSRNSDEMHSSPRRRSRKTARVIGTTFTQLLSALDESEIEAVEDDPYDVLELVLSKLPAATLHALKTEIADEKRRQPIPAAVKRAVRARDGHRCVICSHKESLHLHHVEPVAEGGPNATGNLVTLCANCHMAVHQGLVKVTKPKSVPLESASKATTTKKVRKVPSTHTAESSVKRPRKTTPKPATKSEGDSVAPAKPRQKGAKAGLATRVSAPPKTRKTLPKPVTSTESSKPRTKKPRKRAGETRK